jgi:hypothetical protein
MTTGIFSSGMTEGWLEGKLEGMTEGKVEGTSEGESDGIPRRYGAHDGGPSEGGICAA